MDRTTTLSRWIIIVGLAFVFGYFGIDKFVHPLDWIGWIPLWMDGLLGLPKETWLSIIGAIELMIAVDLLIPVANVRRIGAIIASVHLVAVLWQLGWNDVAVRDIGLLAMSLSLAVRRE